MPANTVNINYARWLASAPTEGMLITVVEVFWLPNNFVYMANHIDGATQFILETGAAILAVPYSFTMTMPERTGTTEQAVRMTGPLTGEIFNLFEFLTGAQSNFRLRLSVRYYLWPSLLGTPLSTVPERFYVTSITFNKLAVSVEASSARLPRKQAGIAYTIEEYPGLFGGAEG